MPRYIAFLRAINVGGHTVTMEKLRLLFQALDLSDVETFIASGNVIFASRSKDAPTLQRKIETHLKAALGYEVLTFLRTDTEIAAIAACRPFPAARMKSSQVLVVAFLNAVPGAAAKQSLAACTTEGDDFHVRGTEAYWLSQTNQSDSVFFKTGFEKALKLKATARNMNTVAKLSAKYPPSSATGKPSHKAVRKPS
ncbi:MAG: DUF1697 domain-containing protein [Gemmatimonadales bacterium]